jgi:hypothetical protein
MMKQMLIGSAAALWVAGPVSALTMTPTSDTRNIQAHAVAGQDEDTQSDSPGGPLVDFNSTVNANASEFGVPDLQLGDAEFQVYGGASSYASASQSSGIGPLSIWASGSASASGNHGDFEPVYALGDTDTASISLGGDFQADGRSFLEIVFSIDEAADFDLDAYLTAGQGQLALGDIGNDVTNSASISLINTNTLESVYKAEISDDSLLVDTSGVIGPGTYKFSVEAYAKVNGGFFNGGDADTALIPVITRQLGYATSADYSGVSLELRAADQPIPEPVTTTLAGLGLGALALQTSRRRRA